MWGMKTTTVPVVIGAVGLIKKRNGEIHLKITGNIQIKYPQKKLKITLLEHLINNT